MGDVGWETPGCANPGLGPGPCSAGRGAASAHLLRRLQTPVGTLARHRRAVGAGQEHPLHDSTYFCKPSVECMASPNPEGLCLLLLWTAGQVVS
jgi:hypothetical protein